MGGAFKIGRISGIDVRVHWTFFLLLAFFAFIGYQASGSPLGALTATVMIVALFLCVLLHEFGHSLANLAIKCATYRRSNDGGKSRLYGTPIARKPLKYRVDEVLDIRFLRHANSAHVLQTLWRGLYCQPVLLQGGADEFGSSKRRR